MSMALEDALLDPRAYPHPAAGVERISTHISHVFLAGPFAYKLKRAVSLGFVDFSTLARRRFYCEEELRLNRRLARQLYLDVVPVTHAADQVRVGGDGPVIDYLLRMHRFPQADLLSARSATGPLIDRLAERIADFHLGLTPAPPDTPFGEPEAVLAPMLDNFGPIRAALERRADADPLRLQLQRLERWTRKRYQHLRPALERRRRDGAIRECHGDIHCGNIVVIDDLPVIFDCIEFNPSLRWIDPMSEIAFLAMDLTEAGAHTMARRFLNRYFELTGDYSGARLLPFYEVYRALVRAKVSAIELAQCSQRSQPQQEEEALSRLRHYLGLARLCSGRHRPQLFVTFGLSGSGKTRLGGRLREHLPIIQLRSDVERKRLFGVPEQQRPLPHQADHLYAEEATQRTYQRLLNLSRELLGAGFSVLVDATFLTQAQRAPFLALAQELRCPFRLLVLEAPMAVLRQRVDKRQREGTDASDATIDVLGLQLARIEPLTATERPYALFLDTEHPMETEPLLAHILNQADAPPLCRDVQTPVATP